MEVNMKFLYFSLLLSGKVALIFAKKWHPDFGILHPENPVVRDGVGATGRPALHLFAVHKSGPEPVQDCRQHRH